MDTAIKNISDLIKRQAEAVSEASEEPTRTRCLCHREVEDEQHRPDTDSRRGVDSALYLRGYRR